VRFPFVILRADVSGRRGFRNGYKRCENTSAAQAAALSREGAGSPSNARIGCGLARTRFDTDGGYAFVFFFARYHMNWMQSVWLLSVVGLVMGPVAAASEVVKVSWHTDVQHAWHATQQQGRPMLVFVTRDNCFYCNQMKDRTYSNLAVAVAINQSFVPLVLDGGGQSPLLKELNVTAFPSTFVISPQAVIVERIDGYVTPEVLATKLQNLRPQTPVARVVKSP
jgi:thioredoxin-related protein